MVKFPCPYCQEKALHYHYKLCTFCCGIGWKYIDDKYPRKDHRHAIEMYREYENGER